jgi:hypothetical protein
MTKADVEYYFDQFVVWMKKDIQREIEWARSGRDAGNLLCALGLVAYSEALGALRIWNRFGVYGAAEQCFNAFFDALDDGSYGQWRLQWQTAHPETTIYEALRCGLVHEYRPKVSSKFFFSFGEPRGLEDEQDVLVFKIEPYFRHFSDEADRLREEILRLPDPQVPPAKTKTPWPAPPIASVTPSS